jgi:hypothetical protein
MPPIVGVGGISGNRTIEGLHGPLVVAGTAGGEASLVEMIGAIGAVRGGGIVPRAG